MTTRHRTMIEDGFATVQEAHSFLGIGRTAMYDLVNGKVITHAKIAGRIVIPWKALREYAASRLIVGTVA